MRRMVWACSKPVMHRSFKPKEAGSVSAPLRSALNGCPLDIQRPVMPIYPRRLKDRPDGHEPSDARSIRAGDAVTVADMVMQRIVAMHAGKRSSGPFCRRFRPMRVQIPSVTLPNMVF